MDEWVDHFSRRVLTDALNEALPSYWLRRAKAFEEAASRADDSEFYGESAEAAGRRHRASEAARQRCRETAEECRRHAALLRQDPVLDPAIEAEIELVLQEMIRMRGEGNDDDAGGRPQGRVARAARPERRVARAAVRSGFGGGRHGRNRAARGQVRVG